MTVFEKSRIGLSTKKGKRFDDFINHQKIQLLQRQ